MNGEETTVVEHVTCLGCGCACDDIRVIVRGNRIAEAQRACPLGAAWFGDGAVPHKASVAGRPAALDAALDTAATLLAAAERPLVYLAAELSCEAQRAGVAIADALGAALDTVSSSTVLHGTLAAQRRGRASATLGELRNRADLVVFWDVNPTLRYPRFAERYAPDPEGMYVARGRVDRTVIAVDVGEERAYPDADLRVRFAVDEEVGALGLMRAAIAGRGPRQAEAGAWEDQAAVLARRMTQARYVALVHDAEQEAAPERTEALIALAQALNGPTRGALVGLRGGGNRSGIDAVLTWQTGFPLAVDFGHGAPRYTAGDATRSLTASSGHDVVLLLGDPATVPAPIAQALAHVRCVAVGPYASELAPTATVAIDTGVAGIHEAGLALRMDDVPLPLHALVEGPPATAAVLLDVVDRVRSKRGAGEAVGRSPAAEGAAERTS
jgi:formylmethanofuran dehydrogenase subunit B